ncbi:hypothetical protein QJS66_19810 [Kocuria rhizophila]|nr:hypothetical protein QJS66_19810 [Kocuria rhizophila]
MAAREPMLRRRWRHAPLIRTFTAPSSALRAPRARAGRQRETPWNPRPLCHCPPTPPARPPPRLPLAVGLRCGPRSVHCAPRGPGSREGAGAEAGWERRRRCPARPCWWAVDARVTRAPSERARLPSRTSPPPRTSRATRTCAACSAAETRHVDRAPPGPRGPGRTAAYRVRGGTRFTSARVWWDAMRDCRARHGRGAAPGARLLAFGAFAFTVLHRETAG